jgi:hypothetical protein
LTQSIADLNSKFGDLSSRLSNAEKANTDLKTAYDAKYTQL